MGIYPRESKSRETRNEDGTSTWVETWSIPGLTRTRTVTASEWSETRDNCFCCSCPEFGNSDPFCRNHGFAGTRPCEEHNMPGDFDPDMTDGMPRSVQAERASQRQGVL